MIIYTVKEGDSLYSVASRYSVSPAVIAADNGITDARGLVVGEALVISEPTLTYTVRAGDSLLSIAENFGISVNQIWRNNPGLAGGDDIVPGQVLVLSLPPAALGSISANGYAYPFTSEEVLRSTLPYLTYITPFSYGITVSGGLLDLNDEKIIELAGEYGVAPIMLISTLTENGVFSSERASMILRNIEMQEKLIGEILEAAARKGYYGIDVDFEYVPAADRDNYTNFIARLREAAEPYGFEVFVALAPKTSSTQPGLLYEGHDYAALGEAANAVLLMTYEWGYTYGPPMAVAPINKVREVLDFAAGEIPPYKIFMGIPNYGYDWTLPFVIGESKARSLSNLDAVRLAYEKNAVIEFDEISAAPYFTYYEPSGAEHIVWFEDARSIDAKVRLINEYGFRGGTVWNLTKFFPQMWVVINSLFNIRKV